MADDLPKCLACRGKCGFDAINEAGEPVWVPCGDCVGTGLR